MLVTLKNRSLESKVLATSDKTLIDIKYLNCKKYSRNRIKKGCTKNNLLVCCSLDLVNYQMYNFLLLNKITLCRQNRV